MASASGLSWPKRVRARRIAKRAAYLGLHRAPSLHYTQGPQRWQGIAHRLKAYLGQCPTEADCSAFYSWCLWNAYEHYGLSDKVNGERWTGGYTGTLLSHGKRVTGAKAVGDAVIYGVPGSTGEHVAFYVGNGLVISHGSEAGPFLLPWRYRSDVMAVRRYI